MSTTRANLTLDESALARVYLWLLSLARDDTDACPRDRQPAEPEMSRAEAEATNLPFASVVTVRPSQNARVAPTNTPERT